MMILDPATSSLYLQQQGQLLYIKTENMEANGMSWSKDSGEITQFNSKIYSPHRNNIRTSTFE